MTKFKCPLRVGSELLPTLSWAIRRSSTNDNMWVYVIHIFYFLLLFCFFVVTCMWIQCEQWWACQGTYERRMSLNPGNGIAQRNRAIQGISTSGLPATSINSGHKHIWTPSHKDLEGIPRQKSHKKGQSSIQTLWLQTGQQVSYYFPRYFLPSSPHAYPKRTETLARNDWSCV